MAFSTYARSGEPARMWLTFAAGCLLLAGCSTTDNDYDKYGDKHSAFQLVERSEFEPIDLASLINGQQPDRRKEQLSEHEQREAGRQEGAKIDRAFEAFATRYRYSDALGRSRRTEIQERILGASDQRCNDFKTLLQKKFANVSFLSGLTSTGASLAAGIVSSAETSKVLSGIAGLASGYRAEYNQAYFANAAVQVVVAGIDSRRRTAYEQILQVRKRSLAEYPLEAAVKDAIRYHGLCSTVSGLQEAGEAVRYYNDPGMAAASRTVARAKMLMDLQGAGTDEVITKLKKWQEVVPAERFLAGDPLGHVRDEGTDKQAVMAPLLSLRQALAGIPGRLADRLSRIDEKLVAKAQQDQIGKMAESTAEKLEAACVSPLGKLAQDIASMQVKAVTAKGDQASLLENEIQRTLHSAGAIKVSIDTVVGAYLEREMRFIQAVDSRPTPSTPEAEAKIKDTAARLAAFKPQLSKDCIIKQFE